MADQEVVAKLKLDSSEAETKIKSFKSQLREATQEMISMAEKFGETSAEARNAAQRVAELKDKIGDAKNLSDAFNPDKKFQAFATVLQGVAGGFAAVQGAMALVGVEGEDVQKTLTKVQAALAFSQGVNSITGLKDAFRDLGVFINSSTTIQKANTAATSTASSIQKLFTGAVDETSTSFKVLKGAIAALGIGLLIIAIGELIANWDKIKVAISGVTKEQEALNQVNAKAIDGYVKEEIHIQSLQREVENENTSKQRKKEIIVELNRISPTYFGNIKTETDLQEKLNAQISKYIQAIELKAKIQAGEQLLQEGQKKIIEEQLEGQKKINEENDRINYEGAERVKKNQEIFAYSTQKNIEKIQKELKPLTDIIDDANKKLQGLGGDPDGSGVRVMEDQNKKILELQKIRLNEIIDTNQRILADTNNTEQSRFAAISKLENAQLQLIDVNRKQQLQNATLTEEDIQVIEAQSNASRKKLSEDFYKQREDLAKEYYQQQLAGEEEVSKSSQAIQILQLNNERQIARQKIIDDAANESKRINDLKISSELRLQLQIQLRQRERLELEKVDKEYDEKQKEKDAERLKTNLDNMLGLLKINEDMVKAQNELRKEIRQKEEDEFQIQLDQLGEWYKQKIELANGNEQLINDITASYERQRTRIVQAENNMRLTIVSDVLGKAADLFGKQTAAGKVLAIAQATINTYTGATEALRAKVPFPEPIATGIRIAQAAVIIAAGLKSIKEIVKTKVPGGDGGAGTAASASLTSVASATAPITPTPQVQTTALDQATLNNIGNATVRAFVVESDVTDNQERITRLNRAARLGG
jgi:hypothetical protein